LRGGVQRLKDWGFDGHFPCRNPGCGYSYVGSWLEAFILHQQPEYLRLIALTKEAIGSG